jgi:hypothetical protein
VLRAHVDDQLIVTVRVVGARDDLVPVLAGDVVDAPLVVVLARTRLVRIGMGTGVVPTGVACGATRGSAVGLVVCWSGHS